MTGVAYVSYPAWLASVGRTLRDAAARRGGLDPAVARYALAVLGEVGDEAPEPHVHVGVVTGVVRLSWASGRRSLSLSFRSVGRVEFECRCSHEGEEYQATGVVESPAADAVRGLVRKWGGG